MPIAVSAQDEFLEPSPEPSLASSPEPVELATSPAGTWTVVGFDAWGEGLGEPRSAGELTVTLLDDGQLEGETGCGRFNGGWSTEDDELFLGVAPTGNLGCGEKKAAEAIGLSTALAAIVSWRPANGGIELSDEAGNLRVILAPITAGEPEGTWDVQRYRRPNGQLTEPLPDSPMSVALTLAGAVEGSTGCRLLLGEYRYDGAGITLGPLEAEGKPCEGPERKAERQLLAALGEVVYWEQSGDAMSLRDGFDEPLVELTRTVETPIAVEAEE